MTLLRVARVALAVLLVLAGALWVGALLSSMGGSPPALLVYGEPVARRGTTWPVRVVAVWPSERRTALLDGSVVTGQRRFPLERGVARVRMPDEGHDAPLVVEGTVEGASARVRVDVTLARLEPSGRAPRYEPWTREIARGGAAATSGPPVYPLTGRVPALLPTSVLLLHEDGVEIVAKAPNAAGVQVGDGRVLRTDASGVLVHVPPAARPGADVEVSFLHAFEPARLHIDLVVNGIVRDVRVLEGDERSRVHLTLPDDARAGWFAVRASPSPLPSLPSAHAVGLVLDDGDSDDPAVVVRAIARLPAFHDGSDPLLRHLLTLPPSSMEPVRALLGRLRADDARAPNLAPIAREQAAEAEQERAAAVARFRVPFRVAGGLFALLAALVALASVRAGRRWQDEAGASDDEPPRRGRGLPSLGWSVLAFLTSLSALWVLDWAIGLTLGRPTG